MLDKNGIAKRIAQEVQNGWYVNLGIGIPTLVATTSRPAWRLNSKVKTASLAWGPSRRKATKTPT